MTDQRIFEYRRAALSMKDGQFDVKIPTEGVDDVALLGTALRELAQTLETRFEELRTLSTITERVNAGLLLDDVLNHVFETFRPVIPYDRIGFSLLENNDTIVRARWVRSDADVVEIPTGYAAPLKGSSLQKILETGEPRILNDLQQYLADHPQSDSTKRIVKEGVRSSLTCPLVAMGRPIGFMFFSSMKPLTYQRMHTEIFVQIAGQLAVIVEKGRLYQQLVELNDLKNKFLGIAAHDLRNPLSAVKGLITMILEGDSSRFSADDREMLGMILESSESMLGLVNDLLDVSSIESGRVALHTQFHEVVDILLASQKTNRIAANRKSIELTVDVEDSVPEVSVDSERIKQVLNNLVSNAIKYSHPGKSIILRARKVGNEVHVAVVDHGQGIPEGEIVKLFKDFSRTSVRPTAGEKSTGLGLAIARRMVEAHGGTIWVESAVGTGSTFTFSLPLGQHV